MDALSPARVVLSSRTRAPVALGVPPVRALSVSYLSLPLALLASAAAASDLALPSLAGAAGAHPASRPRVLLEPGAGAAVASVRIYAKACAAAARRPASGEWGALTDDLVPGSFAMFTKDAVVAGAPPDLQRMVQSNCFPPGGGSLTASLPAPGAGARLHVAVWLAEVWPKAQPGVRKFDLLADGVVQARPVDPLFRGLRLRWCHDGAATSPRRQPNC